MNTYIQKIKSHYIISTVVLLVVVFVGYKIFGSSGTKAETFTVKRGDVIQKVIVNGNTKAVRNVDLGFETNGRVSMSDVSVGTRVYAGQLLASLDSSEAQASLLQAKANLDSAQALLDEMKKGTRPEEIAIAESDVTNAESSVSSKILDAYTKADDAVHNKVDQLFSNPRSTNPQFNLILSNLQLKTDIISERATMDSLLLDWKNSLGDTSKDGILKVKINLTKINSFVDKVASAVNTQTSNVDLPQATLDAYKLAIFTARDNITGSISSITTAESALISAQKELSLKKSGNTPEAIRSQEAKVAQNDASVKNAEAILSKTRLYSPLVGVVTKQDAKVGEIVTPGKVVISVISDSDLEIESNVSEVSIGKVTVGNDVSIAFDAFPGDTFDGKVTYIEPAETIVDGVVNYKVTVAFNKKYPQIRSGLTSKLEIMTGVKKDVLVLPQYALVSKSDGYFVSRQQNGNAVEVPVTVGLRGQDGFVEILSGLVEGDVVNMPASVK